jgi:hypothetical protein
MDEGATAASKHGGHCLVCVLRAPTKGGPRRTARLHTCWAVKPAGINCAFPRIAQNGRQRKESSGAALSSWPVEPQGLHKQNKILEIFDPKEHD